MNDSHRARSRTAARTEIKNRAIKSSAGIIFMLLDVYMRER